MWSGVDGGVERARIVESNLRRVGCEIRFEDDRDRGRE